MKPRSPVDILIPYHGQYAAVRKCVESLINCTAIERFHIHLIDDASPNETFLRTMTATGLVSGQRLPKHSGFASALKAGFEVTKLPWVVFVNSDCEFTQSHWLNNMRRTMERLKPTGIKLVASRTNHGGTGSYPDSLIHENGLKAGEDVITDQPLPLICAMVNRQLFGKIGGFLKEYPIGWYEDEELFWRMKRYGFGQAVCGTSWVRHQGGLTVKDIQSSRKMMRLMEANREKCVKDCSGYW